MLSPASHLCHPSSSEPRNRCSYVRWNIWMELMYESDNASNMPVIV